jgi:EXLDI family protein
VPNKTIYVSEEDLPLYERAQELAGGNLSAAVARGLRRFVETEEGRQRGYQVVTVRVGTGKALRTQRFLGALIGEWRHPSGERRIEVFRVYRTPKNRFALHVRHMPDWAAWSDPTTWQEWAERPEQWEWDSHGGDWRERKNERKRGVWWWGPSESTLEVVDSLEELRDKVPPEFFDALEGASERPVVEDLDI